MFITKADSTFNNYHLAIRSSPEMEKEQCLIYKCKDALGFQGKE